MTAGRDARERKICETVLRIPEGCVSTYGRIAELAGIPRGARQVGRTMKMLPADSEVPWHRVLNARGELTLAQDSPAGQRQRSRLRAEGVVVNRGRVDMRRYNWQVSLDEWMWGGIDGPLR